MKHILAVFLCIALCCTGIASAESFSGTVVSTKDVHLISPGEGLLESLHLTLGQTLENGESVGNIGVTAVYATQDGTVSLVRSQVGDKVDGPVLELTPVSLYRIVSSSADAYSAPETSVIHGGEILQIRCTADRTHLAIGKVANVNGTSFDVFTTAGELYIGEVVNLYRDPDYAYESKVGVGTVVEASLETYSATGYLQTLRVQEGDHVERGQLLYTYSSNSTTVLTSPVNGIVSSIESQPGDKVKQDDTIATLADLEGLRITFAIPETMVYLVHTGDTLKYLRADDHLDEPREAIVTGISHTAEGDSYTVYLLPTDDDLPIGLSVTVDVTNLY